MVTVIDTVYAQATEAPEVVVYVNQFGTPLSTVTDGIIAYPQSIWSTAYGSPIAPAPASTPSTSSSSSSSTSTTTPSQLPPLSSSSIQISFAPVTSPAPVQEIQTSSFVASISAAPAVSTPVAIASSATPTLISAINSATSTPEVVASSAAPATSKSSGSSSTSESSGYGFSYSPYLANNDCKTQEQVNQDFEAISGDYSLVRIYGTDCNQTATVLTAAKNHNPPLKLFAGVFDLSSLSSEIQLIIAAANGDWRTFDTISIGNELVNDGTASAATVVAAIETARSLLTAAHYTGRVVTVDTLVASRSNPSLCDASDYCAVNCHPFFDGGVTAENSGSFLTTQISTLAAVLKNPNQEIVITETGWPWKGDQNGAAIPSPANQAAALSSIKGAFTSHPHAVVLFTVFNNLWKTNTAAQFSAEQYWGFSGYAPSG